MNPLLLYGSCNVALAVTLAGIVARRRGGDCWSFVLYLIVVLVFETAVAVWPERFFVWSVWIVKQFVYDVLKFAVAFELAHRAFRLFPGARNAARAAFLLVIALTTLAVFAATPAYAQPPAATYLTALLSVEPRILNGAIWLLVVTARLVLFFQVPVSDWHRAISLGFGAYLVVSVTFMNLVRHMGWQLHPLFNLADGLAYLLLCCWWARAAWRSDDARQVVPTSVHELRVARA